MKGKYIESLNVSEFKNIDCLIKLKTEMGFLGLIKIVNEINTFPESKYNGVLNLNCQSCFNGFISRQTKL